MKFKEVTCDEITEFFLSDPKLICMGLSDEEMVNLFEGKKYECVLNSYYMKAVDDNDFNEEIYAIVQWELFTQKSIVLHVRVKSKYQKTNIVDELHKIIIEFFKNLNMTTLISFSPESCLHTRKCLKRFNFKEECMIPNSIVWRENLEGLYMYSKSLLGD